MATPNFPKPAPGSQNSNTIAAQYARAKALKDAEGKPKTAPAASAKQQKSTAERLNEVKKERFMSEWWWVLGAFVWFLFIHVTGLYYFTKGFLLTRLVLEEHSACAVPPIAPITSFKGIGTVEAGCWHPKTFDKAVVVIIDALRYDFTIPFTNQSEAQAYHNSLPILYDTAISQPQNAFLLPFIADPPTTTLQRLKGLTTGTLPTFIDAGSNFAGEAIEEDNLLMRLKEEGKRMVHLGDDTWTALFPGYFEEGISKAYPSLNVYDLHTLDNGVLEHIMPLLREKEKKEQWDVMFAHFLGVDHAGHRYGPNHPAMTAKLQQMNTVVGDLIDSVDDDTLLVIMGDHGMDSKGDHGGESDDEVQAALWMYSKKGIFGRTDPAFVTPPATAKIRPVQQIDLLPTLSLLLGLPIPFNNLGKPIEEAFAGKNGNDRGNLAAVTRMAAAGIKRYQAAYYAARGIETSTAEGSPHDLWETAEKTLVKGGVKDKMFRDPYLAFSAYQEETLRICRDLWARFDVPSMILGVGILAAGVLSLMLYANTNSDDEDSIEDLELERAEQQMELEVFAKGAEPVEAETTSRDMVRTAAIGTALGVATGPIFRILMGGDSLLNFGLAPGAIGGLIGVLGQEGKGRMKVTNPFPKTFWGWLAATFTISQSIGFASNSYTIWEDSILLFFLTTFGVAAAVKSLRLEKIADRTLGVYHSGAFIALGWLASFSKLCREEQMPYCRSTYYATANSSTSAPWQLLIPFVLAGFLPSIIKSYYAGSRSYEGFAPVWIGWVFRGGLVLSAIFWTLDAADDAEWFPNLPSGLLKNIRVPIAQTILAIALGAGTTAFIYAPPCVSITTIPGASTSASQPVPAKATVTILGFANVHGTRYLLLVLNILLTLLLVQKPMGFGALSLMTWQSLSLLELLDLTSLTTSPIGPITLALLSSFHFFKTGHQATLASIQWESAFIPLHSILYPYSPILVALNSYGAQILGVVFLPLIILWKQKPKKRGILRSLIAALAWHVAYFATISLATTMWAGHLRRHLMLYRIFCPKFMSAAAALVLVDLFGIAVALTGVRWNSGSVGEIFGWG
ncbi:Alkaline phosphatase-like protein [Glarea lozoyensis ATCC 20868]|uniref:Alkaline phosphatase-like protein n=1 Tax=Glarea lozoyensis (strain ATCC 20868 / MF5171) TaxID=1116229 RepID=S3CW98_GLAL2|nr:Alkaline phosphatase-like protein [Glarea lozoyensis ATCC 20868]EPE29900.1 Alkaline phosphatase-like protein [Glarea lozoyensis ATCC 20868]